MAKKHTEQRFEESIVEECLAKSGYVKRTASDYDENLALFPADVAAWVKISQPKIWAYLQKLHKTEAEIGTTLVRELVKTLATAGSLDVLRHGFKCAGKTVRMAAFAPATTLNEVTLAQYAANICSVARQIPCKPGTNQTIDVVLAVNGIPVVTMELKNAMSGQTAENARRQYENDRDPNAPLFRFKERALVHFAVDTDTAWMCTALRKEKTRWFPFNQGNGQGAGNPPVAGDYRTAYLWEQILRRDSLLDIIGRFLHLKVEKKELREGAKIRQITVENYIFPRFHQLEAVRRLVAHARENGPGHNYLIQHSAGSGKSNSIAWLAHRLSGLHNASNEKIFSSVIVVTDRVVIDRQLQDTIYQFEHKRGVVQKIDQDTRQLAKALASGVPIIVSTIQKFPFITEALQTLKAHGEDISLSTAGKNFAVIIDEAHSSQSGETAIALRRILNRDGIEAVVAAQLLEDEDDDELQGLDQEARENLYKNMEGRKRQPNLSYFAFTATPKFKTLAIFDEPGANGKVPFHLYSMRQAIEEHFILDVLAHYTTYTMYCKLISQVQEDPEVPKGKAAKALARFINLHPHNIGQKVEVMVEHFKASSKHKLEGRAKAMVVTDSRQAAVRYKLAMDKYLQEKGYDDIRTLVAFSGEVFDEEMNEKFTESAMNNGIRETELPERFGSDDFNILLVADKYQTGFDQPLLHTMYVDKKLGGVQAVQTLSRLNRVAQGKTDTFVLDFRNDRDSIYHAFKPYYETSDIEEIPDAQRLYLLHKEIMEVDVIYQDDITQFCNIWFGKNFNNARNHKLLNVCLDPAIERFSQLEEKERNLLEGKLTAFRNLYGFLSQIIPYADDELEQFYTYVRFFIMKLPRELGEDFRLDGEVAMRYYRLKKIEEGAIDLKTGETPPLPGPNETGTARGKDTNIHLQELIEKLNTRFGTDFTPADLLFFDQVTETALQNEKLEAASKVNTLDDFGLVFDDQLETFFTERMAGNEDLIRRFMGDDEFKRLVTEYIRQEVYSKFQLAS